MCTSTNSYNFKQQPSNYCQLKFIALLLCSTFGKTRLPLHRIVHALEADLVISSFSYFSYFEIGQVEHDNNECVHVHVFREFLVVTLSAFLKGQFTVRR